MQKIYRKREIKHITNCTGSDACGSGATRKEANMRARNCGFANTYTPYRVKYLYLGESPPGGYKYFYNRKKIGKGRNFTRVILEDLRDRLKVDGFEKIKKIGIRDKSLFLEKIKENGVVVLDCCQCSTKISTRDDFIIQCFEKGDHTGTILRRIVRNHRPEIMCLFPDSRRAELYDYVKQQFGVEEVRRIPWKKPRKSRGARS